MVRLHFDQAAGTIAPRPAPPRRIKMTLTVRNWNEHLPYRRHRQAAVFGRRELVEQLAQVFNCAPLRERVRSWNSPHFCGEIPTLNMPIV